jgi:hypothetical protein
LLQIIRSFNGFRIWVVVYLQEGLYIYYGARGSVVGLRHYATSRKVAVSSPDEVDFISIDLILPAAIRALGSTSL